MKRNRRTESSLLLGLPDMAREGGALAEETASRAAAALAHFPGGDSWKKILADFAAEQKRKDMAWPGIAALILSGSEADIMRAAAKAQSTDLAMIRTPEEAYMYIPGLVLAETKTGTRGKYHDLLQTLERIPVVTCDDLALVMAAAVESMEWMDQAVYEVYRGFQSVFEADFARFAEESSTDPKAPVSDAAILFSSYAVLKACRLGSVLTEKFAGQAEKNCAKIMRHADDSGDGLVYVTAALVYAEGIRNRDYRDYGRKNGGVLWS